MKTSSGLLLATATAVVAMPPAAIPSVPAPPSEYLALANKSYSSHTDAVVPERYRDPQATGISSIQLSLPAYSAASSQALGRDPDQPADETSSIQQVRSSYARTSISSKFDELPEYTATKSTLCTTETVVQSAAVPSAEIPKVTADAPAYDYAPYAEESSMPLIVYATLLPDQPESQSPSSEVEDWPEGLLPSPTSITPPVKPEYYPAPLVLTIITTVSPSTTITSAYSTDLVDSEPTEGSQSTLSEQETSDSPEAVPSPSCWTTIGTSTLLCNEGEGYILPDPTPTPSSSSEPPTDHTEPSTPDEADAETPTLEVVTSTRYENTQEPLIITSTQYSITNVAPPYPTTASGNGTGMLIHNTTPNSNLTTTRTKWINPTLSSRTQEISTESPEPTASTVPADTSGADGGDLTTRELGWLVVLIAIVVGFWAI